MISMTSIDNKKCRVNSQTYFNFYWQKHNFLFFKLFYRISIRTLSKRVANILWIFPLCEFFFILWFVL